jgi:hypothetical protein
MKNKTIHFVFNEDKKDDKLGAFNTRITKLGPVWTVPRDIDSFLQCISVLDKSHNITIWVHLGAQELNDADQYDGNVWVQDIFSKKFDALITKKLRFISRPGFRHPFLHIDLPTEKIALPVIQITEVDKGFDDESKFILINELVLIEGKNINFEEDSILRIPLNSPFLVKFLQENKIDEINKSLCSMKDFLLKISEQSELLWHEALLKLIDFDKNNPFQNKFWEFKKDILTKSFVLDPAESNYGMTISKNFDMVTEDVKLNALNKQWEIKLNFFYALFEREKSIKDGFEWTNAPNEAAALYVLHEALHQEHKLDYRTVNGIGNFPKTVEIADYQADAFAVIIEFCRYYFDGKSDNLTTKLLREKIVRIIRIAIETTFSFNPLGQLSGIQVRRVNRYLIWFYQIGMIEKYIIDSIPLTDSLAEILNILSVKPVIEISGPALYVNKAKDRILYDLNDYNRHDEELVIFKDNTIERFGKTRDFQLETLIEGFKKSNYKIIYDYISNLFWSKTS